MNKIVSGITEEMKKATESKFIAWDEIVRKNILEEGTEEQRQRVYEMLLDPTIYAYAFFRDPRDSSKPFKAYPYQDLIMNDKSPRVFFVAANQIGKSEGLCVEHLHFAILNPGTTTVLTSKTLPQAKDLLRKIKLLLQNSVLDYKYDIGDTETKTEIYIRHYETYIEHDEDLDQDFVRERELPQSRIICVPRTEAALGYAADKEGLDELPFYEDGSYFYKQIMVPRTYSTKGQIKVYGNPNGQQGIGWELYNDEDVAKYIFNFLDCPTNTQEEFDKLCKNLTREQIDSTLLAKFTSPEGGFFTVEERNDMQEKRMSMLPSVITTPIYIFYDWAKVRDRTVRAIGVPISSDNGEWAPKVSAYELLEYPSGKPYTEIIEEDLKNLVNEIGPQKIAIVGWDNNGVGRGLEDFIKRIQEFGVQVMPMSFSLENKSRIYTLLKLLAENRRIKIPFIEECNKQLSMLRFKKTTRGLLQVHHENERDRDDFPDAIAGLCGMIIQPDNVPVSATIV